MDERELTSGEGEGRLGTGSGGLRVQVHLKDADLKVRWHGLNLNGGSMGLIASVSVSHRVFVIVHDW